MKREYEDYLHDMLENAEKALSFVEGLDHEGFRVQKCSLRRGRRRN